MKVGIVGDGYVGSAHRKGLSKNNEIFTHDVKYDTKIDDLKDSELIFVAVPTPSTNEGFCDTSIVEDVLDQLNNFDKKLNVIIKSTIEPGTTERFNKIYDNLEIGFSPEFLRARLAEEDFKNQEIAIIGTNNENLFNKFKEVIGPITNQIFKMSPVEAEISKYYQNTFNAIRIIFANQYYEICEKLGADYQKMKDIIVKRKSISDHYMDCNKDLKGFGGHCLPKDLRAIIKLCEKLKIDFTLLKSVEKDNKKLQINTKEEFEK